MALSRWAVVEQISCKPNCLISNSWSAHHKMRKCNNESAAETCSEYAQLKRLPFWLFSRRTPKTPVRTVHNGCRTPTSIVSMSYCQCIPLLEMLPVCFSKAHLKCEFISMVRRQPCLWIYALALLGTRQNTMPRFNVLVSFSHFFFAAMLSTFQWILSFHHEQLEAFSSPIQC